MWVRKTSTNPKEGSNSYLQRYDMTDTLVPTEIKPKFIPTGLERRWSSGWNNRAETVLFVFGGWGDSGPKNDIVTFDGSSWNTVKATGDVPSPRRWHASLRLQDQDVALTYGGYNGTHLGGMHLFDIGLMSHNTAIHTRAHFA
jgi:hypothetical protein